MWSYTCNIISEPHRRQGDYHKVGRLKKSPMLNLLENEYRQSNEEQAAQQDGQDGRDHSYEGRANSPFLSAG